MCQKPCALKIMFLKNSHTHTHTSLHELTKCRVIEFQLDNRKNSIISLCGLSTNGKSCKKKKKTRPYKRPLFSRRIYKKKKKKKRRPAQRVPIAFFKRIIVTFILHRYARGSAVPPRDVRVTVPRD